MAYDKVVDSEVLDAGLSAVADAIKEKGNTTEKLAFPDEMVNAIHAIVGSEPMTEFSQVNPLVAQYMANVTYDPSDYTTTEIENYLEATTYRKDRPLGYAVSIDEAGTLGLFDSENSKSCYGDVLAGENVLYNITPNAIGHYFNVVDGNVKQSGTIKPTGKVRMIKCDNVYNVRDIGGWACDGGTIKYGRLFRGAELTGQALAGNAITESGISVMHDLLGINFEVDFRNDSETDGNDGVVGTEDDVVSSPLGDDVEYKRFPVMYYESGVKLGTSNAEILKKCLLYVMENLSNGKIGYIHCMYGRDRTGTVAYILESILGVSQSDMDKEYELTSFIDMENLIAKRTTLQYMVNYFNTFDGNSFRDRVVNWALQLGIPLDLINSFRQEMIDGTPKELTPSVEIYTVTKEISGASINNTDDTATQYQPYYAEIRANSGLINKVTVLMDGKDITSEVWSGSKEYFEHYIHKNLGSGVTLDNSVYKVVAGQTYGARVVTDSTHKISKLAITMGGKNVNDYYSDGVILIPKVTGNVEITITTENASRLPVGYQEVEYIENTGAAYIDTGVLSKYGIRTVVDIEVGNNTGDYMAVIAAYGNGRDNVGFANFSGNRYYSTWVATPANASFVAAGTGNSTNFVAGDHVVIDVLRTSDGYAKFNDNIDEATADDYKDYTNTVTYTLFTRHKASTVDYPFVGKIYSCQIYDVDGSIIRDFVPCYNSDGTIGMYDLVSGTFFTNAGTGTFTKGADVV